MNRGGWTAALLLGAMALWTLLAWGVSGLLAWAGYAVWLLWGIGMLALMLLAALARRYLSAAQR